MSKATNTMSKSAPASGKPGHLDLATEYAATGTFCPFKQPVTQDPIAAGVVLASILPLLETWGQSLAEPQSPFDERKCPMRKCDKMFKTPWSYINHLLLCAETSSGAVSCQKCHPSHVEKPLMSPVRQVLRRLSGARKRRHNRGSELDLPNAKRGRVEDDLESLPTGEYFDLSADPQEYFPDGIAELESMVANYDRLFPDDPESEVARRPLQQSWHGQPPAELAAGPAIPQKAAELYGTSRYSSQSLMTSAPSLRASARYPPVYPWSPPNLGITPANSQLEEQTRANLMRNDTLSHYGVQSEDSAFGLDPRLKCVSGYSLAPSLDGRDSFETESGEDNTWFTGSDYTQYGPLQPVNTNAMARTAGGMTGPGLAGLSVVTQATPAYGQQNGAWTPTTNRQLVTPVSTISAPSATSTQSSSGWDLTSSISSASTGRTSVNTSSPTKSSTNVSSEASGSFRQIFTLPRMPGKPSLVSPGTEAAVQDGILPGTEITGHCEVCPYCPYKPKRRKNRHAHMERHIRTHLPGQEIPCAWPGCDTVIASGRTDNFRQHMIKAHNQPDIPAAVRTKHLGVPSRTPVETPLSASISFEDARWTGQYERNGWGSRRGSTMLTGLVSGNETQFDDLQTPGGLNTVQEDNDELDTGAVRPSDIGPTAWNDNWI